jgi:glutamate formiminotransferase/formiminotetrahydrofolate cyclodeaminase
MAPLTDLTVRAFDAEVASDSPAPGGGSAAALAGSVAAGLVAMVCRLSLGRDDVVATDEELSGALEESERLRQRLLELVDEDTAAFDAIMVAVRMPKDDEAQRSARAAALAEAKLGAAAPPLETLSAARQTAELAASLAGRANANTASDLGVAVHLARAAAEGALLNVAINVATLPPGDSVDRYRRESRAEIEAARASADEAAATIAAGLGLG